MSSYEIPWENCILFDVDNTSVIIGWHNSVILEFRKKTELHTHGLPLPHSSKQKTDSHVTKEFCKVLGKKFNFHDFLLDLYLHFDWSSKRNTIVTEFYNFCDQEYSKMIKFDSVWWLVPLECLTRALKLFPSLKSYFLSQDLKIKDKETKCLVGIS